MTPLSTPRARTTHGALLITIAAAAMVLLGCEPDIQVDSHIYRQLEPVHHVAVVPFVDAHNAEGSGDLVVTAAMKELYNCPGLRIYERAQVKTLIDEHDLMQALGNDAKLAAKIGELTGADAIILGEVMQYEAQSESSSLAITAITSSSTRTIHRVGLSVRAVRVSDGQVIYTDLGEGVSNQGYAGAAEIAAHNALAPWVASFKKRDLVQQQAAQQQAAQEQE